MARRAEISSLVITLMGAVLFSACTLAQGEADKKEPSPLPPAETPAPLPEPVPAPKPPLSTGLTESELPRSGPGTYVWASGKSPSVGRGAIKKYSVRVEKGLDIDVEAFAAFVDGVYADSRGWIADPDRNWGFQRVEKGGIRVVIAAPKTVDKQCLPLQTKGTVSCAKQGYISINLDRWELAVPHWDGDLEEYRKYVVNHEMGHYLYKPHVGCPEEGALAPVMMQQTYFLKGCRGNPWPFPGVQDGPSTEGGASSPSSNSP